ncbi:MAG: zinc-binding dehydrogenase [Bacteroidota bacterium]
MKAAFLVRKGTGERAFEIRETSEPTIEAHEVLVKVAGFGLNFADVMARRGLYKDAPPMPAVLGYDAVGTIAKMGGDVKGDLAVGDKVAAFCRFGGYAEYVATDGRAIVKLPEGLSDGDALALMTQYCTAYHSAAEMVRMAPNDHVLVHAASGGVGTALVQYAKHIGATVYGTASNATKIAYLKDLGADHIINYRENDFVAEIRKIRPEGLDIIFDPIGGKTLKNGIGLLGAGGRLVAFGASSLNQAKNVFQKIAVGLSFGFYHPGQLISQSKTIIGVNMLTISDNRPDKLEGILAGVMDLYQKGVFNPGSTFSFPVEELGRAHDMMENRQTTGKIMITW